MRVASEALELFTSSGHGAALAVLNVPEGERDLALSRRARDVAIAAITTQDAAVKEPGPSAAASALRAALDDVAVLSPSEKRPLADWLDAIASAHG